jgi:hypothetical protein
MTNTPPRTKPNFRKQKAERGRMSGKGGGQRKQGASRKEMRCRLNNGRSIAVKAMQGLGGDATVPPKSPREHRGRIRGEHEENTKGIRREQESTSESPPKHHPGSTLAGRSRLARHHGARQAAGAKPSSRGSVRTPARAGNIRGYGEIRGCCSLKAAVLARKRLRSSRASPGLLAPARQDG